MTRTRASSTLSAAALSLFLLLLGGDFFAVGASEVQRHDGIAHAGDDAAVAASAEQRSLRRDGGNGRGGERRLGLRDVFKKHFGDSIGVREVEGRKCNRDVHCGFVTGLCGKGACECQERDEESGGPRKCRRGERMPMCRTEPCTGRKGQCNKYKERCEVVGDATGVVTTTSTTMTSTSTKDSTTTSTSTTSTSTTTKRRFYLPHAIFEGWP